VTTSAAARVEARNDDDTVVAPPARDRGSVWYWIGGVLAAAVFVIPLGWALVRSLLPSSLISAAPSWSDFTHLSLSNYSGVFGAQIHLWRYVLNSLLVAGLASVLVAVLATLAGYGFARFDFLGSGWLFGLILLTLMVPFQAVLTPLFLELNAMHLTDSRIGLALFYTTFNLPFGVFVMRNTFAAVPNSLEDSAYIDGCGTMRTLIFVLRPLILPGVATTVLYAFLASWTDFLGALTFITRSDRLTLPVELLNIEVGTQGSVDYGLLTAGAVVAMIPCIVLYIALQRFYVRGLASGAVKG
jgi:multiple sugar transport system permease protein